MSRAPRSVGDYCEGVLAGDRRIVAKAITLLESRHPEHLELGQQLLDALLPHSGNAVRVGVTGPPGVGKSTFIERLGLCLIDVGQRVAVLAVDPSSPVGGGSILGDKTRMLELGQREGAFIRPTPSGGVLGGVAHATREALIVCEAAGFDVVLVETVGVGQSEAQVASMVDFFLVLLQPGAGDELQGIKKGALELADDLVVHKADGETLEAARRTAAQYAEALHLLRPASPEWTPRLLLASGRTGEGIPAIWERVLEHRAALGASGELAARRRAQDRAWLWELVHEGLRTGFRTHLGVAPRLAELEERVGARELPAPRAAAILLRAFRGEREGSARGGARSPEAGRAIQAREIQAREIQAREIQAREIQKGGAGSGGRAGRSVG